jgi:hypothetical protein
VSSSLSSPLISSSATLASAVTPAAQVYTVPGQGVLEVTSSSSSSSASAAVAAVPTTSWSSQIEQIMHMTPPAVQVQVVSPIATTENINILRSIDPIVEFGQNDLLLLRCFPLLFFLGTGIPSKGSLSTRLVAHLLLYYDQRFAKNVNFGFLLCNQKYRHKVRLLFFY